MKVQIQNGSQINLEQKNFLAAGGEGQIYVIGDTTYKIYNDPSQMIPSGKVAELAAITNPNVIKPEKLLFNSKSIPVGYTSKYIHNEGALCQIFTKAFRERHQITPQQVSDLVKKLQTIVADVHRANCLIVDLNEMNFLLGRDNKDIFAIDVASYQTPHYHATALMESVRDRHMKPGQFNEGTDWFAYGILSFQMFVGIHPYKGRHPSVKGMDERMLKNISVLHKDVGIPQSCYPLSVIPKNYLNWYSSIFEKGERTAPPTDIMTVVVPVKLQQVLNSTDISFNQLGVFDTDISDVWTHYNSVLVATKKSIFLNQQRKRDADSGIIRAVGFTVSGKPISVSLHHGLTITDEITGTKIPCALEASQVMSYNGTIFLKVGDKILSLLTAELGADRKVLVGTRVAANVLEHATTLYSGVAIQSLLGACYVSLFPTSETHYQVRIPELDGVRIQDAKYDNQVLMIVGFAKGIYNRWVFRFDSEHSKYDVRIIPDIKPEGLNFVTIDSGVCICYAENDVLEIFRNSINSNSIRVLNDANLSSDMKLLKNNGKVLMAKDNKLFSLSMK